MALFNDNIHARNSKGWITCSGLLLAVVISFTSSPVHSKIPVQNTCLSFFKEYTKYAGNFSSCELLYAEPFRLCNKCMEVYVIMSNAYKDLAYDDDLADCRVKFMKSDRVQVFPEVQRNMENIWNQADCDNCFVDIALNHTTKKVSYGIPPKVMQFMELYGNLSHCMNTSLEDHEVPETSIQNFDLCTVCLDNYTKLNELYNKMSDEVDGNVCMDIVDRMNYTRLIWSHHYNCSCRSSEPAPIIIFAIIFAASPIFYYIIVRVTRKVEKKTKSKQKRLNSLSQHSSSFHQTLWRPNDYRDYQSLTAANT